MFAFEFALRDCGDSATGDRLYAGCGAGGFMSSDVSDEVLIHVIPLSVEVARERAGRFGARFAAAAAVGILVWLFDSGCDEDRGFGCREKSGDGIVLGVLGCEDACCRFGVFGCGGSLGVVDFDGMSVFLAVATNADCAVPIFGSADIGVEMSFSLAERRLGLNVVQLALFSVAR